MFRGALSGGGGRERRRSQRAAGGVRSDSRAPRRGAAAHPALGLRGPAGAKTRSADAAAGSRPLGARAHAHPGSAPNRQVPAGLRRARGRGAARQGVRAGGELGRTSGLSSRRSRARGGLSARRSSPRRSPGSQELLGRLLCPAPDFLLPPPLFLTNNPDRLKDRKGEVGGKTNPISSDQTVRGSPLWVSFHLVCVCWGGR